MTTEEQRVCDICGVRYCLLRVQTRRPPSPDHWQRGYTRANERAEGLAAKVAALEAGAAQRTLLKEVDDAAYVQLRTRSVEAEARAEIDRVEALWGIARRAPSRPKSWPRGDWFHMSRETRRDHFYCCWLPLVEFDKEDLAHSRRDGWWLEKPPAGPSTAPLAKMEKP